MSKTVTLSTPLSAGDAAALRLDDTVYLSGDLYVMMYAEHFQRVAGLLREGLKPPMDLSGGVIYHTGTVFRRREDGSRDFLGIGATTSSKFNAYTPEFLELTGVRAVIGKGGMDRACLDAMRCCGCVYLAVAGGCSALYTEKVEGIAEEYWPQKSWADNMLRLRVKDYGPLFVSMDAHGESLYERVAAQAAARRQAIYDRL